VLLLSFSTSSLGTLDDRTLISSSNRTLIRTSTGRLQYFYRDDNVGVAWQDRPSSKWLWSGQRLTYLALRVIVQLHASILRMQPIGFKDLGLPRALRSFFEHICLLRDRALSKWETCRRTDPVSSFSLVCPWSSLFQALFWPQW